VISGTVAVPSLVPPSQHDEVPSSLGTFDWDLGRSAIVLRFRIAAFRRALVIDFADVVQLFMVNIDGIRAMYDKSELAKKDPDALSHAESGGANAIVSMTNNVLRKA
jgi:hypothetical protein